MATPSPNEITELLAEWGKGDRDAFDRLFPLLGAELRRLARRQLRRERRDHTLQTTALVHEAYLRLVGQDRVNARSRAHFFGIAAQAMRRILVDHARRRLARKRGAGLRTVELDQALGAGLRGTNELLIALDEALAQLSEMDPLQARVVELRIFGGLTVEETARSLRISTRTVKREFSLARVWLHRRIRRE